MQYPNTHSPFSFLLQMHDMLNLSGHTDRDSESGCSGSYTDSGRGPSEEGDNYLFNNSHLEHPYYPPAESRSKYCFDTDFKMPVDHIRKNAVQDLNAILDGLEY